jgi:hypothetical protein
MSDAVPDSLIPYDAIVQDTLRQVVRRVLDLVAVQGLPGQHHFYIAFRTRAPGIDIPKHLVERYPEEMTIVIQHRYWDLKVDEDAFQIGLSFNQVPARLRIPYAAITGFFDPAVNFALQFQPPEPGSDAPQPGPEAASAPADAPGGNVVALDRFRKK